MAFWIHRASWTRAAAGINRMRLQQLTGPSVPSVFVCLFPTHLKPLVLIWILSKKNKIMDLTQEMLNQDKQNQICSETRQKFQNMLKGKKKEGV